MSSLVFSIETLMIPIHNSLRGAITSKSAEVFRGLKHPFFSIF